MRINRHACAPLFGLLCAGLAAAQTGLIQTYAGNGTAGYSGDGGPATSANLANPVGLVVDGNGNLYIADATNRRVREVNASTGITTVAGGGTGGAGGLATAAMLQGPCGVAFDSAGDLYISDTCTSASGGGGSGGGTYAGNGVIWRVDAVSGIITIAAGGGTTLGDGGPATSGAINLPVGIAIDSSNDIFIADSGNNRIRRVDGTTGIITTVAGNGTAAFAGDGALATAASLNSPSGVALDAAGNLYIADSANNRIRRVDAVSGIITTVAGTGAAGFNGDGIAATSASLDYPITVALNSSGNLLVADSQNYRTRMIDMTSGLIWTLAGTGFPTNGCCGNGDGGPATKAPLDYPAGLAVLPTGPLFISELQGDRVREISLPSPYADTALTISANSSGVPAGQPVTLTATVAAINGLAGNATGAVAFFDGTTTSLSQVPVTNGSASYSTSALSEGKHSINAIYSGDSSFAYAIAPPFSLTITAPQANVALAASPNPANPNQAITLTATVTPSNATGSVQFQNGGTSLGIVPLTNGAATLSGVTLASGTYSLTAQYGGGNGLPAATSPVVSLTVKAASSVALSSSVNPSTVQQSVTFTAAVTPATATGSVQFLDGSTALGTATLSTGAANFSTSSLAQGTHSITASYTGDANDTSASSSVLTQTVQAASAVSISTNQNPVVVGGIVVISAVVTPATATGTVQFLDGSTVLGTAPLASGAASFTTTSLAQGTHQLTAVYSGDASDAGSTSAVLSESIKLSVGFGLTLSPNPAVVGQTVTMTVGMSAQAATGTVSFSDGSTLLGTVPLSAGTAVFSTSSLRQGTHSINVVYSGDSIYLGASAAPYTETILGASSVALTANPNPALSGQPVIFTATVSPSAATGTVSFYDGQNLLATATLTNGVATYSTSALALGTHSLTASYGGSSIYNASTSAALAEVVKANTSTVVSSSANPATVGAAVTFTATVSPSAATGAIQFLDGSTILGSTTLSNGSASFSTSALAAGTHSISAVYGGSGSYNSSTSSVFSEAVKNNTSVALSSSLNPTTVGSAVTFTATVSPPTATGTLQFLDGATLLGTVTLSGGSALFTTSALPQGSQSITAAYGGDGLDNASTSAALAEIVNPAEPAPPANLTASAAGSGQINLSWTASATSGVTYNVYESSASGFTPSPSNRIASGVAGTAYSVTGLTAGTTYYYRVSAVNAGGESAATNQAGATAAGFACHVNYSVSSQWNTGFDGAISIENAGTTNITSWSLTWTWPGNQHVSSAWNAKSKQSGENVTLTNDSYNGKIKAGATLSGIGFSASYSGTNTAPEAFYVNGTLCQ